MIITLGITQDTPYRGYFNRIDDRTNAYIEEKIIQPIDQKIDDKINQTIDSAEQHFIDWFNLKIDNCQQWMIINGVDIIAVMLIIFTVYLGYRLFFTEDKSKIFDKLYISWIGYLTLRLFWRVVFGI